MWRRHWPWEKNYSCYLFCLFFISFYMSTSHPGRVEVSLSKTPNPQLLLTSWLVPCMAANRRWCVNGWMRGINCTALWIKALYKCSPSKRQNLGLWVPACVSHLRETNQLWLSTPQMNPGHYRILLWKRPAFPLTEFSAYFFFFFYTVSVKVLLGKSPSNAG